MLRRVHGDSPGGPGDANTGTVLRETDGPALRNCQGCTEMVRGALGRLLGPPAGAGRCCGGWGPEDTASAPGRVLSESRDGSLIVLSLVLLFPFCKSCSLVVQARGEPQHTESAQLWGRARLCEGGFCNCKIRLFLQLPHGTRKLEKNGRCLVPSPFGQYGRNNAAAPGDDTPPSATGAGLFHSVPFPLDDNLARCILSLVRYR